MILIWIFITTFVLLAIIFFSRAVEIKTGRNMFIPGILSNLDTSTTKILLKLGNLKKRIIKIISFVISEIIPFYGKVIVNKIKIAVKNKYHSTAKTLKGYKNLEKNKGVVSTFLKKVSEVEKANGDHKKGIE